MQWEPRFAVYSYENFIENQSFRQMKAVQFVYFSGVWCFTCEHQEWDGFVLPAVQRPMLPQPI